MKNSAGRGGCYPPVDNILRDLQNSSYLRKPHSIIALLFIQNTFKLLNKENLMEQREFLSTCVHPLFSPRRKTFVKLPLTPLQL